MLLAQTTTNLEFNILIYIVVLVLWFVVGMGIGLLVSKFVLPLAKWIGVTLLIMLLLTSIGVVRVQVDNISRFFDGFYALVGRLVSGFGDMLALDSNVQTIAIFVCIIGILYGTRRTGGGGG